MEDKTKAVALDRQCGFWYLRTKLRFDNTRAFAGGQSLSSPDSATTKSLPFELPRLGENPVVQFCNSMLLVFSRAQNCTLLVNQYLNHTAKSGEALKYGIFPPLKTTDLWFKNGRNLPFNPNSLIKKQNSKLSFVHTTYLSSGYSCPLAFLRCRRLISPLAAVTRNPAVLSPSSFKSSISSITSWGILTVVICDFAFFAPVAITDTPRVRCISVYAKIMKEKDLKCISLWASLNIKGEIHLVSAKPGSASNTNRASDHNPLYEVTIMAALQSTQTRPEFTWRFLGKYSASKDMRRIVVHIIATSEAEARSCFPLWDLVFAARLPANHLEVLRHA